MKFNQAIQKFSEWGSGKYSARTLEVYVEYLKRMQKFTRNKDVERFSYQADIGRYREHLRQRGISDSTINLSMISLRQMWKFLYGFEKELGIELPFLWSVIPVKSGIMPRSHRPIKPEEFQKMIAAIGGRQCFKTARDTAILQVLYHTGMRVSELTSLNISSLDIPDQTLTVITRKRRDNCKYRQVPYPRETAAVLQAYVDARQFLAGGEALFISTMQGTRLTRRSVARIVKIYAQRAGLDPKLFKPHCFRHGWGMRAAQAEMYPLHIQTNLGHTNLSGSQPYFNVQNAALKREYHLKLGDNSAQWRQAAMLEKGRV